MNENELATMLLPLATRVARRLSRDPEDESLAGESLLKAMRSFDGRGTLEGHVSRCIRIAIFHRWRKVKVRSIVAHKPLVYMEAVASYDDPVDLEPLLTQLEWQIICEKFELGWPYDVVAKRHGTSTRAMKERIIPALLAKLEEQARQ